MEKTKKKNWIVSGLLVLAFVFGLFTFLGVKAPVQTVYATGGEPNPKATASQVTINNVSPLSWSGVTFDNANGVLTIDASFPNTICDEYQPVVIEVNTSVTVDLTVVITHRTSFYAIFANLNGNLTIEGDSWVRTYETYVGGNLTIKAAMFDILENPTSPFILPTSTYHSRNSIVYAGEKISIEGKARTSSYLSSSSMTRSLLCAKSLEINTKDKVQLTTNSTKGSNKQAPIVFHSCNSADDLVDKLVIRQGALKLTKYYNTEDTQYNDYFGFVGYTSDSSGAISNTNTNFDTENKAFTGYEIAKTNTDLIVKTRTVDFSENGGTFDDFLTYSYLPIKTEPITVTLPECPYTAPAGKQFAGWALESATATPLKQPGDTFVLEDGGYEYDSSNYYSNYYNVYAIWEDIPEVQHTVSFNSNGGSGTMAGVQHAGTYTLPACTFTAPDGKEFDGWALSANGAKIDGTTINITENTELFALWKDVEIAPETKGGLSAGAVVAIVLAVVVVGGVGGFALVWFVIKKKKWADFVALFKKK